MSELTKVTIGLYRHFKGGYYYVSGLCRSATDEKTIMVNYFDVCHPEYGNFVRPLDDFCTEFELGTDTKTVNFIVDRKDNVTGQFKRFERVQDLNFQLGSVSTEQLISELRGRSNSPIHELDIEELHSKIYAKDYIVGEPCRYPEPESHMTGVHTIASFSSQVEAEKFFHTHRHNKNTMVFKRVFIEV